MKSKTIIISSQNEKSRGILTIFQEEDLLKCRLRLYSTPKLSRFCKLGVYHNKEVYSANLLEKNGVYESSMVGNFDIDQDFYTAIVDTSNNNQVLLSGGTYAGYFFNNETNENENIFEKIEKENPKTSIYTYPDQQVKPITQIEEIKPKNCEDCDKCLKCKYKEFFYKQNQDIKTLENLENNENFEDKAENTTPTIVAENTKENIEEEKSKTKNIIESIIPQFQYVFENYNPDETLNNLIPNSKFVKINDKSKFSLDNEQYSIGAIYEDNEMKYICYARLCNYNTPAPEELGKHYQWLPLDKEDPLSEGYYIVFQDAHDLKIVEL